MSYVIEGEFGFIFFKYSSYILQVPTDNKNFNQCSENAIEHLKATATKQVASVTTKQVARVTTREVASVTIKQVASITTK